MVAFKYERLYAARPRTPNYRGVTIDIHGRNKISVFWQRQRRNSPPSI
jgi:hypothetical protein